AILSDWPLAAVYRLYDFGVAELAQAVDDAGTEATHVDEDLAWLLRVDDLRHHARDLHRVLALVAFETRGKATLSPDDAGAVVADRRRIDADDERATCGRLRLAGLAATAGAMNVSSPLCSNASVGVAGYSVLNRPSSFSSAIFDRRQAICPLSRL